MEDLIYKKFCIKGANSLTDWLDKRNIHYSRRIIVDWNSEDIDWTSIEIGLRKETWENVKIDLQKIEGR